MFFNSLQALTFLHFAALCGLLFYGLHRLWLIAYWWLERRKTDISTPPPALNEFPLVTIQLPIYNERFVAARLINAVAAIDWPSEKLEIQVLDDSTDDTIKTIDHHVKLLSERGMDIRVLRRDNREGYKAGALQNGMRYAKGEFIAIFDADFLPNPDFLRRTVPAFSDPGIGMVQARWSFLNEESSWLTGLQSLLLSPHFSMEHWVRFRRRVFFNFNGTAGIWRKRAIESAGGWESDTVTEDLDLSYRAQMKGWRFVYMDDVAVPSELPITLAAFRSQQQRWAKGSIQTARKILPTLLTSPLPIAVKMEAVAHLMANFCWLLGSLATLTLYAAITWRAGIGPFQLMQFDIPLMVGTSVAILLYFFVHALANKSSRRLRWVMLLPIFSIGMSPSLSIAVIQGALSRGGTFERTPKFGISGRQKLPLMAFLYRQRIFPYIALNILFMLYSFLPVLLAWHRSTWIAIPFLMLFPSGFMLVMLTDILDMVKAGRNQAPPHSPESLCHSSIPPS